jgi:hypothetical protein
MSEKTSYKGEWFLLEDKNHKIKGTLFIDENSKIKLELDGTFNNNNIHNFFIEPEYILGITSSGEFFTLIECYQTEYSQHSGTSFSALSAFKGLHLTKEDNIFSKGFIISNCIDHFMNKSMFDFDNSDPLKQDSKIIVKKPFEKEIIVSEDLKIYFRTSISQSYKRNKIELIRKSNIIFHFSTSITLFEFIKKVLHTIRFLSILSNQKASAYGLKFYETEGNYKEYILFTRRYHLLSSETKEPRDYVLDFDELEKEIDQILVKWYSDEEKFDSLTTLLVHSSSDSGGLLESKFLNLCKFLELFHKIYRHNNINEEKSKRFQEVIEDSRQENKEWLERTLDGIKYPSFKERITELLKEGNENTLFKTRSSQFSELPKIIKWSRDYYTHYNQGIYKKALKGEDLLDLTGTLRVLVTFLILKELKIPIEKLNNFFSGRKFIFN